MLGWYCTEYLIDQEFGTSSAGGKILQPKFIVVSALHSSRSRYSRNLVERAEAAGFRALCVTVDAPVLGRRERDRRNEFTLPPGLEPANLATSEEEKFPQIAGESGLFTYFAQQLDPGLTWQDLAWLRSLITLLVVVKGILRPDDALRAVESGAEAIIVSNHDGRQLDGAIATIDALADIVAAVEDKIEVLVDGGIRRATDILKALSLRAKAVLIGLPILWGLAVEEKTGVKHVLEILHDELDVAMALSGCARLQDVDPSLIRQL